MIDLFNIADYISFWLTSFILLYAEIHYTFKGIYSRLKKKEPEIIADVPYRVDPGMPIPVLLLVKDATHYPVELNSVKIELSQKDCAESFPYTLPPEKITELFWYQIFEITPQSRFVGKCKIDVSIKYTIGKKHLSARNDNYSCSSHAPFEFYSAPSELPKKRGWHFGEFHCHTNYTSDQVEFGAPLAAAKTLAQAMGLTFFCATDHSYDLDDKPDNYLQKDPSLQKWHEFRQSVQDLNASDSSFIIVPGEEVSAGNSRNRNVHFLILNHPDLLPGDGDSAEKWFRTRPNLTIREILEEVDSESLAFAAHPGAKPPLLEWLLVRRGKWSLADCSHGGLNGLQIWNGSDEGLAEGKSLWVNLLLKGKKIYISGGNDAHGNFNRFRQIGLPFFTMREHHLHLFGKVRTGVYIKDKLSLNAILKGFKQGRMIITDGPFIEILVRNERKESVQVGETIFGETFELEANCLSSVEFGALAALQLYWGNLSEKKEEVIATIRNFTKKHEHTELIKLPKHKFAGYLRAELYSQNENKTFRCLTNPIWFNLRS